MRLEFIPVILGVLVAFVGIALLADAGMDDAGRALGRERRRRTRADRNRGGEALLGAGALCLAAALVGRDTWRYGTVAVLLGVVLLLAGAFRNRRFLRELFAFRGPARRAAPGEPAPTGPELPEGEPRLRIR